MYYKENDGMEDMSFRFNISIDGWNTGFFEIPFICWAQWKIAWELYISAWFHKIEKDQKWGEISLSEIELCFYNYWDWGKPYSNENRYRTKPFRIHQL